VVIEWCGNGEARRWSKSLVVSLRRPTSALTGIETGLDDRRFDPVAFMRDLESAARWPSDFRRGCARGRGPSSGIATESSQLEDGGEGRDRRLSLNRKIDSGLLQP
jgi:hypothetical protein